MEYYFTRKILFEEGVAIPEATINYVIVVLSDSDSFSMGSVEIPYKAPS
jgi:hypothetical protein